MYDTKTGLKTASIVLGLIVSILLVLISKIGVFTPVYPIFKGFFGEFQLRNLEFFQNIQNDFSFFSDIAKYRTENDQLRAENTKLSTDLSKALLNIQDLQSIKTQLSFDLKFQLEPVRVIKYSDSQTEVFLNKGSDSKIKVNDILVLNDNLVGVIIESSPNYSLARLIISNESKVPITVVESKAKGFALGDNSSTLQLKEIPNNVLIAATNKVVSAGSDGVVPYGLVVGQIDTVNTDQTKITQEATVKSKIRFNDLRDLFVIIK